MKRGPVQSRNEAAIRIGRWRYETRVWLPGCWISAVRKGSPHRLSFGGTHKNLSQGNLIVDILVHLVDPEVPSYGVSITGENGDVGALREGSVVHGLANSDTSDWTDQQD